MAMNPMQRRAKNSFLIGFLFALIIMAVVVMGLLYKIKGLNEDFEELKALQKKVYVASDYIQSGTEVSLSSFKMETVQTSINQNDLISEEDYEFLNEDGTKVARYDSFSTVSLLLYSSITESIFASVI